MRSESHGDKKHKRGSSLTNKQQVSEALETISTRAPTRNRSSPDITDLGTLTSDSKSGLSQHGIAQTVQKDEDTSERKDLKLSEVERLVGNESTQDDGNDDDLGDELSQSTSSALSAKSDKTIEVNDKDKRSFSTSESLSLESEGRRLSKEQSVSSSTLINDKQDDEGATPSRQKGESGHHMSIVFRQELLNICQVKTDSRIGVEVAKLSDPNVDLVQLLGRCLPHIVPNVILAKREVRISLLIIY